LIYKTKKILDVNFSSKLIEDAVGAFSALPGIGRKTALRLVLHLVKQPMDITTNLTDPLVKMRSSIRTCGTCHNISDANICSVCADTRRDRTKVMVIETIRDVMAIEDTQQYRGLYHVLGGVISPIEGIGPQELNIDSLMERVAQGEIKEIIMALSPTIEGDTTIYYVSKKVSLHDVKISTLARGIAFGGELEYADEVTLGRSIVQRIDYKTVSE
jgi:recombination protein RecR